MKKIYLIIIALVINTISNAQSWEWLNPKPTGNDLYDIQFVSQDTGFIIGKYGELQKTCDGGVNWEIISSDSFNSDELSDLFVVDSKIAFIGGFHGIYKSNDGCNTWTKVAGSTYGLNVQSIYFINKNIGFAACDGQILKTTNGGSTWQETSFGDIYFKKIQFVNENIGFACGGNEGNGVLYKTTNKGITWNLVLEKTCQYAWYIHADFINSDTGYVSITQPDKLLFRTFNGGLTWDSLVLPQYYIRDLHFLNNQIGFIAVDYPLQYSSTGAILKTSDGGLNWNTIFICNDDYTDFRSIFFRDYYHGYAVGNNGIIIKTEDAGTSWQLLSSGFHVSLCSLCFSSNTNGVAVGSACLHTDDGGVTWNKNTEVAGCNDVDFSSEDIGYAVGWECAKCKVYKTQDGGVTWNVTYFPEYYQSKQYFVGVDFVDNSTGFIVGYGGLILRTQNGGQSWYPKNSGTTKILKSICFPTQTVGYAVGDSGIILKTINKGYTWTILNSNVLTDLYSVSFINENVGYASGAGSNDIIRTLDGGQSWNVVHTRQNQGIPTYDVKCLSENSCMAISFSDPYGVLSLIKTTNGGQSWTTLPTLAWYSYSGNPVKSYNLVVKDNSTCYVGGGASTVIKFNDINLLDNKDISVRKNINVYPNPVKGILNIKTNFPDIEYIAVYSVNGQLLYKKDNVSNFDTIDLSNFKSGTYILKVSGKHYFETIRVVKL